MQRLNLLERAPSSTARNMCEIEICVRGLGFSLLVVLYFWARISFFHTRKVQLIVVVVPFLVPSDSILFFVPSFLPSPAARVCHITFGRGTGTQPKKSMVSATLSLLAKNRGAVLVAAVANTASLLFGYDTGVAGSVVALQRFTSPQLSLSNCRTRESASLTTGYTASDPNLNTLQILRKRLTFLPISSRC